MVQPEACLVISMVDAGQLNQFPYLGNSWYYCSSEYFVLSLKTIA